MKVGTRLSLLAAGTIVVVALVGGTCTLSVSRLVVAHKSATHTREVIEKLDYLMFRVMDASAAHTGFLVNGQRAMFDSYRKAVDEAQQALDDLRVLVRDSSKQIERVDRLGAALKERWELLSHAVDVAKAKGRDAGIEDMRATDWVHLRKEWTLISEEIRADEIRHLEEHDNEVDDGTFIAHMTVLCGTIFAGVFVGFSNFLFGHHITACVRKLLKASDNIEKGRFDTVVSISSTDEFADLADAYTTLGQKLLYMSEELHKSKTRADRLNVQLESARQHLVNIAETAEEDTAALLEQAALKADELGEHSQMLLDGLKASSTEVLHRVSAVQEKLEFSAKGTEELCTEVEKLHHIQALLDDLATQLEVVSMAANMELSRSNQAEAPVTALLDKFKTLTMVVREEKVNIHKLISRMHVLASKALLSTQDSSASLATTKLSSAMLLESVKGFPDLESECAEMLDDLIASIRSQAAKLIIAKDRLREMIREITLEQLDHNPKAAVTTDEKAQPQTNLQRASS